MLSELSVSNYAIIESASVAFGPGLNVITGETGSGKSVLTGALAFALGARAGGDVVRDGAKEAEVAAVFGDRELRRTIVPSGRSRAWIDGESVSLGELREAGAALLDMHGPGANARLVDEEFQRSAIDAFDAACRKSAGAYAVAYSAYVKARAELEALEGTDFDEDAAELLKYQIDEIEAAAVDADDDDIEERHRALAHASEIVSDAGEITEAIGGDRGAAEMLIALQPKFAAMARHLPEASEWAAEAEEATRRLQELSRSIADAATKIDVDERDFERLDERLSLVARLKRKYLKGAAEKPFSEAMAELLEKKKSKLSAMLNREEAVAEAKSRLAAEEGRARKFGAELMDKRSAAAARFASGTVKALKDLGFLQSRFHVEVSPSGTLCASGTDRVKFMFEPNPGESPRELADIASSGEIARVMLAVKSVLKKEVRDETLVFDEIDANVGGETGRKVGERLLELARGGQVIAITHLPQTAACGQRHLAVEKRIEGGRTLSRIRVVEGDERVGELARMFGADESEKAAWAHARELLAKTAPRKKP